VCFNKSFFLRDQMFLASRVTSCHDCSLVKETVYCVGKIP
jgi:hypothetical protein